MWDGSYPQFTVILQVSNYTLLKNFLCLFFMVQANCELFLTVNSNQFTVARTLAGYK